MRRALHYIRHTFRLLFQNIGPALRISVPWLVLMILVIMLVAVVGVIGTGADPEGGPSMTAFLAIMAAMVFSLFAFGSIAAAWHRYILLNERPSGLLPGPPAGIVWPYVGRLLILTLVMMAVFIPVATIGAFMIQGEQGLMPPTTMLTVAVVVMVMTILFQYVFLRLAISLPAVALGNRSFSILDGWKASKRESGAIFWAVVIMVILSTIVQAILGIGEIETENALEQTPGLLASIGQIAFSWFYMMFSICILTTLYGVLVEGRDI